MRKERELESDFSLLTPGGQKGTRLLPFLRVKVKLSDFDFDVDVDADKCGRRHCPGVSDDDKPLELY